MESSGGFYGFRFVVYCLSSRFGKGWLSSYIVEARGKHAKEKLKKLKNAYLIKNPLIRCR